MAGWRHPTAVVDRGARVGAGTKIWHFCHVMSGAQIGPRCVLGQGVFVSGRARVGAGCRIQNNVSIYDGVVIDKDVFVGPSAVFTNVRNPRAAVDRRSMLESTIVSRGATIGANATIVCGVTIGEYAFVGAGAVVATDVAPHAVVTGVPARRSGWICRCGAKRGVAREIASCSCEAKQRPVPPRAGQRWNDVPMLKRR